MSTKQRINNLGQNVKVWKVFKFESSRRIILYIPIILHLHIAVVKTLQKTLIAMWQMCETYSRQELYQCSLAVDALAFWAGCVELISVQFQSLLRDRKYLGVRLGQLRFSSKYSTPWWAFRKDRIVGVRWYWFFCPRRPKNRDRGKTRSSSVAVQDFCSQPIRAHRCQTVFVWDFSHT